MSMNRSLGEGRITKITKRSAVLICERLGTVTFPITAANVSNNDCIDLREKYTQDEMLIFTAQKQSGGSSEILHYVASSVIKRRELLSCSGKITECFEKFCYATVPKYGRVFIPYSARVETKQIVKAWLGKGAEVNRVVNLKIFRQPDINNCRYVAWSLSLVEPSTISCFPLGLPSISSSLNSGSGTVMSRLPTSTGQLRGAEKQPENAKDQVGVIVSAGPTGDCVVYSVQTGLALIPATQRQKWMTVGRFLNYDATKITPISMTLTSAPSATSDMKVTWTVKRTTDLGFMFEVVEDFSDKMKLVLVMKAVVNRMSSTSRCGWCWNDMIGRVYLPPGIYNRTLKPFSCVEVRAAFTGSFEDVPWSAAAVKPLDSDEFDEVRWYTSQLLFTDDNWTVKFIQIQNQTFYGFMDNPAYGSAFIAWTDLNETDTPPPQMTRCRATVYYQQRDGKHAWRALLVTPLDENGDPLVPHPVYTHTGKRIMQDPFIAPESCAPPVASTESGPIPNHWNMSMTKPIKSISSSGRSGESSSQHSPPSRTETSTQSIGVIGSGIPTHHHHHHSSSTQHPSPLPPSPPASSDSPEPLGLVSPEDRIIDDGLYDSNVEKIVADYTSLGFTAPAPSIWKTDYFKWSPINEDGALSTTTTNSTEQSILSTKPKSLKKFEDFMVPFQPAPLDMLSFRESLFLRNKDAATQTDERVEDKMWKEMMESKELRSIMMSQFPKNFEHLMNLKRN